MYLRDIDAKSNGEFLEPNSMLARPTVPSSEESMQIFTRFKASVLIGYHGTYGVTNDAACRGNIYIFRHVRTDERTARFCISSVIGLNLKRNFSR